MEHIEYTQPLDNLGSANITLVVGVRKLDDPEGTLAPYAYIKKEGIIVVSSLEPDSLFDGILRAKLKLPGMTKLLERSKR